MPPRPQILLIDDDVAVLRSVSRMLTRLFHVVSLSDSANGPSLCRKLEPDVVVTDLEMPNLDGQMLIDRIHAEMGDDAPPFIVLTAAPHPKVEGAARVLEKPGDIQSLPDVVLAVLESRAAGALPLSTRFTK